MQCCQGELYGFSFIRKKVPWFGWFTRWSRDDINLWCGVCCRKWNGCLPEEIYSVKIKTRCVVLKTSMLKLKWNKRVYKYIKKVRERTLFVFVTECDTMCLHDM